MKIVIPGGSGQVGTVLSRAFFAEGHDVVVLSRNPRPQEWRTVYWDAITTAGWVNELEGADAIINLAGFTVNCRYTQRNRNKIKTSRVASTRLLGEAVRKLNHPPHTWLQASTATIYAHRFDAPNDELTGIIGGGEPNAPEKWNFSIDVARAWESAFDEVALPETRKIKMRSALILSPDPGGIFDTLLCLVRTGLGGSQGSGMQYVSWVHHVDFIRAVSWLIHQTDLDGIVNIAAPNPIPNREFMRELREAWGVPLGFSASKWMLEIGAVLLRTETELVLKSRRVVPGRLIKDGFHFDYPAWGKAAQDLCLQWRRIRDRPYPHTEIRQREPRLR
jgi:uncharacterized protein